jgi:hypothetical protein
MRQRTVRIMLRVKGGQGQQRYYPAVLAAYGCSQTVLRPDCRQSRLPRRRCLLSQVHGIRQKAPLPVRRHRPLASSYHAAPASAGDCRRGDRARNRGAAPGPEADKDHPHRTALCRTIGESSCITSESLQQASAPPGHYRPIRQRHHDHPESQDRIRLPFQAGVFRPFVRLPT